MKEFWNRPITWKEITLAQIILLVLRITLEADCSWVVTLFPTLYGLGYYGAMWFYSRKKNHEL